MSRLALLAVILLAACAAPAPRTAQGVPDASAAQAAPEPRTTQAAPEPRTAREGPTYKGQRDLDVLVSFFTGNFDPRPGEPPVRIRVAEFWKGSPVRWLYLEWAGTADGAPPTRQLVFRVAETGEESIMTTTVHRLPGDPARFAGEYRKPRPFEALQPRDLDEVANCRLKTRRTMTAHFTLVTDGNKCPAGQPGAPFLRYEFSLTSSELKLLEQPRDAAGNVPRSRLAPYSFARTSVVPK